MGSQYEQVARTGRQRNAEESSRAGMNGSDRAHVPIVQMQQRIGNQAMQQLIQNRIDTNAAQTAQASPARFGPYAPQTYRQLLSISLTLANDLRRQLEEVEEGVPIRAECEEWLNGIQLLQPYLLGRGEEPIDSITASQAAAWYEELLRLRTNLQAYKRERIERNLESAKNALAQEGTRLLEQRDAMRDQMRSAFLSGDENAIAQAANYIGTATDIGLGVQELARKMAETIAEARGGTIPAVSRYTEMISVINKTLAAANMMYSLANIQGPTELVTAANGINAMAGVFSSGGTLIGLSAHMGLYANLYLVPLTQAILTHVTAILSRHLHELNVVSAHTGFPLEMSSEPGGWPMFHFMMRVMRDGVVPDPVPEDVADYLLDQREMLEKGAGSAVPTTGMLFWRSLDEASIGQWVLANRQALWSMFYGSMPLPR